MGDDVEVGEDGGSSNIGDRESFISIIGGGEVGGDESREMVVFIGRGDVFMGEEIGEVRKMYGVGSD